LHHSLHWSAIGYETHSTNLQSFRLVLRRVNERNLSKQQIDIFTTRSSLPITNGSRISSNSGMKRG